MIKTREIERLNGKPRLKVWLIGLFSGVLLTLCQPPADVPLLGLVALVPLFIALPRTSRWGSWLMGFLVGVPYFWIDMWWLGQMVTDPGNEWIIFAMFAFVATVMSAFYGFAAMQVRWLLTRRVTWTVWFVPFVWLGFEFLHEFNTPAPYPWLPLGVSLADFTAFAQTADIWGQYGLTWSCAFVAMALAAPLALDGNGARFVRRKDALQRLVLPGAAIALLVIGCVYGAVRMSQFDAREAEDGPWVACVQGNLPQEVKVQGDRDPARLPRSYLEHIELTRKALNADEEPELVCWAETMLFGGTTREGLQRGDPEAVRHFFPDGVPSKKLLDYRWFTGNLRARIAHEFKTPMLVGAINDIPPDEQIHDWKDYGQGRRSYNTAMLFDAQGRVSATYDKRYLVPGGEYIPLEGLEVFDWAPVRDVVEGYSQGLQGYTARIEPGLRTTTFRFPGKAERLKGRQWAFTSTICYEYAWPGCYIELHEEPERYPDFHVNISNEGWFKRSAELDQAVDFCRLRCIESRVPMIRATNTGITCSIDACGRVVGVLDVNGDDREVQGIMLAQPKVLTDPLPPMFVALVNRSLGWVSLLVIAGVFVKMVVGRVQERNRRRRAKQSKEGAPS